MEIMEISGNFKFVSEIQGNSGEYKKILEKIFLVSNHILYIRVWCIKLNCSVLNFHKKKIFLGH